MLLDFRRSLLTATSIAAGALLVPSIGHARDPSTPPGQEDNGAGAGKQDGKNHRAKPHNGPKAGGAEGGRPQGGSGFERKLSGEGGNPRRGARGGGNDDGAPRSTKAPGGPSPVLQKPARKPAARPDTVETQGSPPANTRTMNKPGVHTDRNARDVWSRSNRQHQNDAESGGSGAGTTPKTTQKPPSGNRGTPTFTRDDDRGRPGNRVKAPTDSSGSRPAVNTPPPNAWIPGQGQRPGGNIPWQVGPRGDGSRPAANRGRPGRMDDIRKGRKETKIDGGKDIVIKEPDNRTIIKQNNKIIIQHDDAARIRRVAPNARFERRKSGATIAVVDRPGGVKIYSESDANGHLIRRYRRDARGRDTVIIDNRRRGWGKRRHNIGKDIAIGAGIGLGIAAGAAIFNSVVDVPPPRVRIPRDKYIVDYDDASEDDVYEALSAPPVEDFSERYTLDQIRATPRLRERMRRVDLDDINFETGSWEVDPSEYRKLDRIARAMARVIERNPNEVFMIEGYTDAVGSREDNLSLSDRRAESVAEVLSEQFQVPFENLTTQGYGEDYLKVDTDGPERINRRVAVRRITPLLSNNNGAPPPRDDGPDEGDEGPNQGPTEEYHPYDGPPDRD